MGGAPLHPLVLHKDTNWHRLSHLVRLYLVSRVWDEEGFWHLFRLRLCSRCRLGVCGGLRQYVRAGQCGPLTGLSILDWGW